MNVAKAIDHRLSRLGRMVFLVCLAFVVLFPYSAGSAEAADHRPVPTLQRIEYLKDPSNRLSLTDVLSAKHQTAFQPHPSETFRFGLADTVIWIRFMLPAFSKDAARPVLIISRPNLAEVDLYLSRQTVPQVRYQELRGGLTHNPSPQDWGYRFTVFDLPHGLISGDWLYLRIYPKGASANFKVALADPASLRRTTWLEIGLLGMAFGVLIGMLLYNASLFVFLKDNAYLLYLLYILFMFLFLFCRSGLGRIVGMPLSPMYVNHFASLSLAFAMAFSISFLGTRKQTPIIHWLFIILMALSGVNLILTISGEAHLANQLMHLLGLLGPILAIVAGIIRTRHGFYPARFYLTAWLVLSLSVVVVVLADVGLIPNNFLLYNALFLGSAAEAILLSMALGARVRMLRLERRVMKRHERHLTELSLSDELTGLFNKRGYFTKLSQEMDRAQTHGRELSLLILDVDHFKDFNDTYGHAAGDKILAGLGKTITQGIRSEDVPCRYGGEEFVVILPGSSPRVAGDIAERLRRNFESLRLKLEDGQEVGSTISLGVAALNKQDNENTLFQRADAALYKAKSMGRNQVVEA